MLPLFLPLQASIYSPPNFTAFLAVMSSLYVKSSYPSIITRWCSPFVWCPRFLTMQSHKERMQKQAGGKEQPFFAGSGEPLPPSVSGWWCHSRNTLCSVAAAVRKKRTWSWGKGRERSISSFLDLNSSLCKRLKHLDIHLHLQREGLQFSKGFLSIQCCAPMSLNRSVKLWANSHFGDAYMNISRGDPAHPDYLHVFRQQWW